MLKSVSRRRALGQPFLLNGEQRVGVLDAHTVSSLPSTLATDVGQLIQKLAGGQTLAAGLVWPASDYPPEDLLYFWGSELPRYFIENTEV